MAWPMVRPAPVVADPTAAFDVFENQCQFRHIQHSLAELVVLTHKSLAHNPVTSFSVNGPFRFPVGLRLSRRHAALTQWEADVAKHFPDRTVPQEKDAEASAQASRSCVAPEPCMSGAA